MLGHSPLSSRPLSTIDVIIGAGTNYSLALSTTSSNSSIFSKNPAKNLTIVPLYQTVSATHKINGTGTGTSFSTSSFTTVTGRLYIATVYTGNQSSTSIYPSNGLGITWTQIGSITTNAPSTCWYGVCTSGQTGTLTINNSHNTTSSYLIDEITNANTTNPIQQSHYLNDTDTTSPISFTLSSFARAENASYISCISTSAPSAITESPEGGWTTLGNFNEGSFIFANLFSAYKASNDTSPSMTWTGSSYGTGGWAVEINAASIGLPVGTSSIIKVANKLLSSSASKTATIVKSPAKRISTTASNTTSMLKNVAKLLSTTVSNVVSIIADFVSGNIVYDLLLETSSSSSSSLVRTISKALLTSGSNTSSIIRSVAKALNTSASNVGSIIKNVGKTLSTSASNSALFVGIKTVILLLTTTASNTTSIIRNVAKQLSVSVSSNPTLARVISRLFSLVSSNSSSINKVIGKLFFTSSSTTKHNFVSRPFDPTAISTGFPWAYTAQSNGILDSGMSNPYKSYSWKVAETNTVNSVHYVQQGNINCKPLTTYTFSVSVKAAERTIAGIFLFDTTATKNSRTFIDLSTGTLNNQSASTFTNGSWSVVNQGNGWYRVSVTGTTDAATSILRVIVYPVISGTSTSYVGTVGSGIYHTGWSLTETPTAVDYILEAGNNLGLYTQEFSKWTKGAGVTVTDANATDPFGVPNSASTIVYNTATNAYNYVRLYHLTPSTQYTYSVWIKGVAGTKLRTSLETDGTLGGVGLGQVTHVMDGTWTRYTRTFTTRSDGTYTSYLLYFYASDNTASTNYTFEVFGAQVNVGATALDYERVDSGPYRDNESILFNIGKVLTTSSTSSSSIIRAISRTLLATGSNISTIAKAISRTYNTTVSNSASILRNVAKLISTSSVGTATLTAIASVIYYLTLTATSVANSSIVRNVSKQISVTASNNPTIVKVINKVLNGVSVGSGSIIRAIDKLISAQTVSSLANVSKDVSKTFTVEASNVVSIVMGTLELIYNIMVYGKNWFYERLHKIDTTIEIEGPIVTTVQLEDTPTQIATTVQIEGPIATTIEIDGNTQTPINIEV